MKYVIYTLQFFICIFLFVLIFAFLSVNIIDWMYSDESYQYSLVKNRPFGFIHGIFANWCCVSIGRPSASGWIDFWMSVIQLLNLNSIYGFFFYRIVTFIIIIFFLFFLIKYVFHKINTILILSLTLSFYLIYLLLTGTDVLLQIYGVEVALYGISVAYTFLFIIYSLKIHKINHPKRIDLFLFYFFLLLYLNSVYAHLVTGGLILYFTLFTKENFFKHLKRPYFSFKNIFFHNFFRENYNYLLVRRTKIEAESVFAFGFMLYLISALINLFSPSLSIREEIWPSDTSFLLGLYNSLPVLEGLIINEWSYYYFLITAVVAVLSVKNNIDISKYSVLLRINLILLAPIIVILTNALAFTSVSLQGSADYIFKQLFIFGNIAEKFENFAGISTRHLFFYNFLIISSFFFIGIEIGNLLSKIKIEIKNYYIINFFVISTLIITVYSNEFNHFISFAFKKNDELHERINVLKFNHRQFTNAKANPKSINFIKEFDYEKGNKSYSNTYGRSVPLWFHHYWGLEKGKELYNIKSNNIFRLSHQVQNYLKNNNINIYEECREEKNINNLSIEGIEVKKNSFDSLQNYSELNSNFLLLIEMKIKSYGPFL